MINQIKIENYKSITSLEMDLGRVNVLIGENGSGKTNILEAVAVGAAAEIGKLNNEYLLPRGIRVSSPKLTKPGFQNRDDINIEINFHNNVEDEIAVSIDTSEADYLRTGGKFWKPSKNFVIQKINVTPSVEKVIEELLFYGAEKIIVGDYLIIKLPENELDKKMPEKLFWQTIHIPNIIRGIFFLDAFLIFCPENTFLRRFEDEGQIRPLGVRGEGLFSHLAELARKEPETFQKINSELKLIDWFDNFEIPSDLMFTEKRIQIRDRYLEDGIQYIDQRSSNEGFLFLLFYVTLFVSPHTPKFFAIDNIDNALNPKLCSELIKLIVRLAKENDKQVIVTAHNPGLLDGLNLNDEEQRLFVISRNKLGHTKALRIEHKPSTNGHEPVRLSEQFLRGYIGGLPKNF